MCVCVWVGKMDEEHDTCVFSVIFWLRLVLSCFRELLVNVHYHNLQLFYFDILLVQEVLVMGIFFLS